MNRERFHFFTWLMWAALPLMALRHWQLWDRLPANVAVHFNAANQPNGWMSRADAFRFDILLLVFLLTIFTIVVYVSNRNSAVTASSWAVLLFFYGILGVICYIEESVLEYNLYGIPVKPGPVGITIGVLAVGLITALAMSGRGRRLPASDLISEEVQAGRSWAVIVLLGISPFLFISAKSHIPALWFVMVPVVVILLGVAAMAWDGFHYLFTRHGLEVRTLGFRLKSLPREQIRDYAISRCRPLCGYGIRGMGGRTAYLWTHNGVRVNTNNGSLFLGHTEPEKIVRDLDRMMNMS